MADAYPPFRFDIESTDRRAPEPDTALPPMRARGKRRSKGWSHEDAARMRLRERLAPDVSGRRVG